MASVTLSAQTLDKNTFGGMSVRQIGPATMSGRISALDALQSDPRVLYVGAAGGGVWKSTNAGTTFESVFDDYPQSIGAISIDQNNPDTVWVGTGEKWTRNSVSFGAGLYKTTNGGDRWKLMGLEATERIADIVIHPEDPNVVWVAALGHLWGPNPERGVYKTTDGGKTWELVLFVDENTGCAELIIDPENPDVLYASLWDFRRTAYDFRSGGPGSGLYKTTDGGANWSQVQSDVFPQGTLGRISIAFSGADHNRMYTLIESDSTALFRSDDRGQTWEEVNRSYPIAQRPFYFSQLYPDPEKANLIYKPGFQLLVSKDGGKKFASPYSSQGGRVHPDHHAFFISEKDPNWLYLGTDGGVYRSFDAGATWEMMRNLPVSTFYHVSVDTEEPYQVYGGLQDNGSWVGPSNSPGGIGVNDWRNVGGGDGFYVFPDKQDDNIIYWQSQGGNIIRSYQDTRENKSIRPVAPAGENLRFNWNTPVRFSEDGARMYVGAQYLFRSTNKGDTWERISPDLTTNDPAKQQQEKSGGLTIDNSTAENHTTIITIAESPLNAQ
ncbi:MAG TPA: glycosyl hydrolase, partial [Cytophagales bacterium]|nr:glycosyl hydrolase [Cytophagales bacterium]